jgi:hypothetical protein
MTPQDLVAALIYYRVIMAVGAVVVVAVLAVVLSVLNGINNLGGKAKDKDMLEDFGKVDWISRIFLPTKHWSETEPKPVAKKKEVPASVKIAFANKWMKTFGDKYGFPAVIVSDVLNGRLRIIKTYPSPIGHRYEIKLSPKGRLLMGDDIVVSYKNLKDYLDPVNNNALEFTELLIEAFKTYS